MNQTINSKKVLLAFSSYPGKGLLREIFTQLDPKIRLDLASNELEVIHYLSRNATKLLPALIIFDSPPVRPNVAGLVDSIRKDDRYAAIPIAFLIPQADLVAIRKWLQTDGVSFFPPPSRPSECKLYVRQMLELCKDANASNDVLCIS
jgi:hypothetical protein